MALHQCELEHDTLNLRLSHTAFHNKNMNAVFRLRNDLYCVEWGIKLYSLTHLRCCVYVVHVPCKWLDRL